MRMVLVLLCREGAIAFAQLGRPEVVGVGPQLDWTLGVHRSQPTMSASVQGNRDGRLSAVDTDSDLGLRRTGSPLGLFLEYQGQIHAFRLAYDTFRLEGDRALPRDIWLDGLPYATGTALRSKAKIMVFEGLYTYKFIRRSDAWMGLDLGAQFLKSDLSADALSASPTTQVAAPSLPIPQVGISGWSSGADGLLESRVFYRYFTRRGATCTRYGLDARAYLYPHFGLRAFFEASTIRIPRGSTQGDLDIRMDSRLTGVGMVVRF